VRRAPATIALALALGGCTPTGADSRLPATMRVAEQASIEWRTINTPDGNVRFAIARPGGEGPFPAAIILHGRHGSAQEYVTLASDLAAKGVIAIAACWFDGGDGTGSRFITPIACAEGAPSAPNPAIDTRPRTIAALVQAARGMPDVGAVALIGHSRGGGAIASYLLLNGDVEAAILNSAGYGNNVLARAGDIRAPVLILHGDADSPADGGSAFTHISRARRFEQALRNAGGPVEAFYYEGGRHNGLFEDADQYRDEIRRIASFLRQRSGRIRR